jgi:excisionase family DNA binding protein
MPAIAEPPVVVKPQVYECDDVAALLKISSRQVWRLSDAGVLPGIIRIGRSVRWNAQAVDEWISQGCPRRSQGRN